MGYFTRVFCKSSNSPSIQQIILHLNNDRQNSCFLEECTKDPNNTSWTNFTLKYKDGKLPLFVELNKLEGEDSLVKEEISEFINDIGRPGFSFTKRKVISHLKQTKYIIVVQIPTSDIDDDGYETNEELLKYFAVNFEGLVQADGEGFYNGTKLIVKE
jgi:hypothetical protein